MIYNSIPEFLNAIEEKMQELTEEPIAASSSILPEFTDEQCEQFDSIVDEASAMYDNEADITDYISTRLADLGYTDDEITQILDYEGF